MVNMKMWEKKLKSSNWAWLLVKVMNKANSILPTAWNKLHASEDTRINRNHTSSAK